MDQQELKTLRLIEALETDAFQSQRDLSKKLDISLGLVNALLKRVVKKGYYKVVTANKSKFKYILTPKGISEKSILTYRYILYSIKFYEDTRKRIKIQFNNLINRNIEQIVLVGIGELAEIAYITAKDLNLRVLGVADKDSLKNQFLGMKVIDLSLIGEIPYDAIIISEISKSTIYKNALINYGVDPKKIVQLV